MSEPSQFRHYQIIQDADGNNVELVRDVYGPGKGSRWLTQVLHSDLDPAVQKGLFAVWRNNGESAEPSYWVNDTSSEPRGCVHRRHRRKTGPG